MLTLSHNRPAPSSAPTEDHTTLIGESAELQRLRSQIARIAPYFRVALVSGETGVGKSVVARELHASSGRGSGPFVVCDEQVLEDSTLSSGTPGTDSSASVLDHLSASALGGTLCFEEIGQLSPKAQGTLIRLLDRLRSPQADTPRLVLCTNRNLKVEAAAGNFRQDLLYRVATVELSLAPLRDRKADIAPLAVAFVHQFAESFGKHIDTVSPAALEQLTRSSWGGNVRELQNVLRNAVMSCDSPVLDVAHLGGLVANTASIASSTRSSKAITMEDCVEEHALEILRRCDGNKLRAAEMLQISRSTLYRILEAHAARSAVAA